MECRGCVYYRYESDTNYSYCIKPNSVEFPEECNSYYSIEDAKADAKYGHCDKY